MSTLEQMREDFNEHAAQDTHNYEEITRTLQRIEDKLDPKHADYILKDTNAKLDPIVDAWKAVLFNKSFLSGLGGIVASITIIGGAIYWLLNQK